MFQTNYRSPGAEPPASCTCGYRGNVAGSEWMPSTESEFTDRKTAKKKEQSCLSSFSSQLITAMAPPTYNQALLEVSAFSTVSEDCEPLS